MHNVGKNIVTTKNMEYVLTVTNMKPLKAKQGVFIVYPKWQNEGEKEKVS